MNSDELTKIDGDVTANYFRSPIVCLFDSVSTSDKYRIEVKYGVEYVPTGSFEPFVETKLTNTDDIEKK